MTSRRTELPISGMTNTSCVSAVEEALLRTNGVIEATVDPATDRATIAYDDDLVDLRELVEAVGRGGYQVPTELTTLIISGMTCVSCAVHVQGALEDSSGVVDAHVNLSAERAAVTYVPGLADVGTMKKAVLEAGYKVV